MTRTEDFDKAAAAGLLAQNPALVSMMQAKLSGLVGRSSGYVESLPANVRRRVAGLKGVQKEHAKLEAQFQEEVLELEKKYFQKFTPLYQKRAKIVNGDSEPSKDEIEAGEADEEDEEEEDGMEAEKTEAPADDSIKGIPEFWLSAMKNQVSLAEMITERDEEALKFLTDIRMEYLEKPGFKLIFEFAPNEFFTNKTVSKTYYYQEENGYGGDFIYDHAEGEKIDWQPNKDLTTRIESKKQRNKSECLFKDFYMASTNDYHQTPSRLVLCARLSHANPSSTSSTHQSRQQRTRTTAPISKSALSSTISSVKTSRRSSFHVLWTGLRARLCSMSSSMTLTRETSRTRMTMRTSSAMIVMRMMTSQMRRYVTPGCSSTEFSQPVCDCLVLAIVQRH